MMCRSGITAIPEMHGQPCFATFWAACTRASAAVTVAMANVNSNLQLVGCFNSGPRPGARMALICEGGARVYPSAICCFRF
jgi:hypothetical protein